MDAGIIIQIVLLIAGFVFLIKGSDLFVDGSSNIAYLLKIPTIIVGLTIVAFGTSAPEAAVSIASSLAGSNSIAIGNIVGSNLFNILFIIGITALLSELKVEKSVLKQDLPFLICITLLLVAVDSFGSRPAFEGLDFVDTLRLVILRNLLILISI